LFLTQGHRALVEKLTATQLLLIFLAFYGTQSFITVLTKATHTCPCPQPDGLSSRPSIQFEVYFIISLPSTPRSSKRSVPFTFPHQNSVWVSHIPHNCYILRPSHSNWFKNPNNVWLIVQITTLLSTQASPFLSPSLLGPNIFLSPYSRTSPVCIVPLM